MGRYRLGVVMLGAYLFGCAAAGFPLPWWVAFLVSALAGWHADNLARWIGRATP